MDEAGSPVWVERTVRQAVGARATVTAGATWLVIRPDGVVVPEHGWKLHVSARVSTFPALVEKLLPLLAAEGCLFKLARSQDVLRDLNGGLIAPATVGKAFTIYPHQTHVREFGLLLAHALRGHRGPRVLSDRRVLPNSPVYYRYGGLSGKPGHDRLGRTEIRLRGPDGDEFDGLAGLTYRQPSWAVDPFAGVNAACNGDDLLLGGRYRLTIGIRQAAQGNVYRAVDTRDGTAVVVKQARAHVAEYSEHNDTRMRLRNERRVLAALAGVTGVPRFIDHFRHGDDEFLVTTDCGPRSLVRDVQRDGPYRLDGDRRSVWRLASDLAGILIDVHRRGVVMRDLSPANVVVGERTSIIDFGLSAYAGIHLPGSTPGYAPPRQMRDEPPRDVDDFHALGMVLLFAATGLHPVTADARHDLPRTRALQTIRQRWGPTPSGILATVVDLLGDNEDRTRAAARRAAARDDPVPAVIAVPALPEVTPEMAAELTDRLVDDLLDVVDRVLGDPDTTLAANDVSIYSGSAGVGIELLHHVRRRPAVEPRIRELAEFTACVADRTSPSPGLFAGSTGTDIFLREAAVRGLGATKWAGRRLPSPSDWAELPDDLIDGTTGIGLGHLYLHRADGDAGDLAVARQCADAIRAQRSPGRASGVGEADATLGRAHGLAGTVELLLASADEPRLLAAAADRARDLATVAETLIAEAADPAAEPMTVSWCRGLAGIGHTLSHAGTVLNDASLARLARRAANACIVRVPQLSTLGQCCGAVGVGNFLIDIAAIEKSERYHQAALDVATHLVLRSSGPPEHPRFTAPDGGSARTLSWAHGLTGLVAFFRRLSGLTPDLVPIIR